MYDKRIIYRGTENDLSFRDGKNRIVMKSLPPKTVKIDHRKLMENIKREEEEFLKRRKKGKGVQVISDSLINLHYLWQIDA